MKFNRSTSSRGIIDIPEDTEDVGGYIGEHRDELVLYVPDDTEYDDQCDDDED